MPGGLAHAAQVRQRIAFTVVFGHHAYAGGAAVHDVGLGVEGEFGHYTPAS